VNNDYITLGVWIVVVGAVFLYLWRKGHLLRLSTYTRETKEELRKCTWPSWAELKGATVVVMISIAILGVFTVLVDYFLVVFVSWVTKI